MKIVLIVVACVLAVLCVAGAVGGYLIYHSVTSAIQPARNTTREFVNDLQTGQVTDAYGYLCTSTKASFTPQAFQAYVAAQPPITRYAFTGFSLSSVNGQKTATVDADLIAPSGAVEHHSFLLLYQGGQWYVCGQPY